MLGVSPSLFKTKSSRPIKIKGSRRATILWKYEGNEDPNQVFTFNMRENHRRKSRDADADEVNNVDKARVLAACL